MDFKRLENAGFELLNKNILILSYRNIYFDSKIGFSIEIDTRNKSIHIYDRHGCLIAKPITNYNDYLTSNEIEMYLSTTWECLTSKTLNFDTPTPQSPYKGHEARIKELEEHIKFIKEYMGLCIKDKI